MRYVMSLALISALFSTTVAFADNVILMIGDGMGFQHIECVGKNNDLFMNTIAQKGEITTYSANQKVTDSAAGATAYACGLKTNNSYLGVDRYKKDCQTLAESSIANGLNVVIRTTDVITGATPSAFYAHVDSRYKTDDILKDLNKASETMDIKAVQHIDDETKTVLDNLKQSNKPFFVMIEESETDKQSHLNNYDKMSEALVRFDKAIKYAVEFANNRNDTTVIVVADHETGGLTNECTYTIQKHTHANVPYFVAGHKADLFTEPVLNNIDIHHKIKEILFTK